MKFSRMITVVDSHAEGNPMRVVIGGVPHIPGTTIIEKMRYVRENWDHIRTFLVDEPRGHSAMCASLITEPTVKGADVGIIYMSPGGYDPMCGHGTICLCTVLVETGMVEAHEPETEIVLDTPAGIVGAKVAVKDGSAKSVTLRNVPSFLYKSDVEVDVPTLGPVKVDIAYGGDLFFAVLPAKSVGLEIKSDRVNDLISYGVKICDAASKQVEVQHPEKPEMKGFSGMIFTAEPTHPKAAMKNTNVVPPGLVDRSPCGTGTCALMAILHANGELGLNEEFVNESIIGSLFTGKLIEETMVGPYPAVVPTITGSAWIMGIHQFVLDPDDPFPAGFYLGKKEKLYCAGFES